jgi:Beta-lactamase
VNQGFSWKLGTGHWKRRAAIAVGCVVLGADLSGQRATFKAPVPRFADPDRRATLAKAFPDVDRLFQEFAARSHIPGAAWGIVIDGALAHGGVTGTRDIESKAPVTPDSVFRIASMTKSFTAIAILKLRDEGKLSLDDPAENYVPEMKALVYPTSDSPKITIRHLLSHAEGFPEDNPWGDQQLADSDAQLSAMIRGGIPFSNAPGTAYEWTRPRDPGEDRRPPAARHRAVAGADVGARGGGEPDREVGRRGRRSDCSCEPVPRSEQGSAARGHRDASCADRRLHGRVRIRSRRECAARRLDDDVRARAGARRHHTRADHAAQGAVHVGDCRARGGHSAGWDVSAVGFRLWALGFRL